MKIRKVEKKLQLKKETVSTLTAGQMNGAKGKGGCNVCPQCQSQCNTVCGQNTCFTCVTCNTCDCTVYDNTCQSVCAICESNQQGACNW